MAAIGNAILPVTVSIRGITGQLNKQLEQPAAAAAKRASDSINKSLKAGAEDAAKAVEQARSREERATQSVVRAENALQSARSNSEQKAKAVEAAENRLEAARNSQTVKVSKAEADLAKLRESGKASVDQIAVAEAKRDQVAQESAARIIDAENRVAKARDNAKSAAASVMSAEDSVTNAKTRAAKASEEVISATKAQDAALMTAGNSSSRFSGILGGVRAKLSDMSASLRGSSAESDRASSSLARFGSNAEGHFSKASSASHLFTGSIGRIGGAIGALAGPMAMFSAGWKRATGFQESEVRFKSLGLEGKKLTDTMEMINKVVSGTTAGLDEASQQASMLMTSGVQAGDQLEQSLQALVTASAVGGKSVSDLGVIFQQVAAAGKLQAGDALQLTQAGVPIMSWVAKSMGKSMEEVQKMSKDGLITYDDMVKAIRENGGSLAKDMSNTFQGQMSLLKSSVARLGENIARPLLALSEKILPVVTGAFNQFGKSLKSTIGWFNQGGIAADILKVALAGIGSAAIIGGVIGLIGFISQLGIVSEITAAAVNILNLSFLATPVGWVVAAVGAIVGAFVLLWKKSDAFRNFWTGLWDDVKNVASAAWDGLVKSMQPAVDFFKQVGDAAQGVWDILTRGDFTGLGFGIEEDSGIVDFLLRVHDGIANIWDIMRAAPSHIWDGMKDAWDAIAPVMQKVGDIAGGILSDALDHLKSAWDSISHALSEAGKALGGAIMDAFHGLSDAAGGLWDALKKLWDVLEPVLLPVLKTIGYIVGGVLIGAFLLWVKSIELTAKAIELAAKAFSWIIENAIVPLIGWVGDLASGIGDGLGGVFSWVGDVAQGFADGLVWAWQKIQDGWNWLSNVISVAWNTVIKPVFDFMSTAVQILAAVVGTAVLGTILAAWNLLSAGVKWAWENVLKPAWDAVQAAAMWMWTNVLQPVFGWIQQGWQLMIDGINWAWQNVLKPAWDGVQAAAQWMWLNVLQPTWNAIQSGWQLMIDGINWAWLNVLKPAWEGLQIAAQWMWTNVLQPTFGFIQAGWQAMVDGMKWVYDNVLKPTWDAMGAALRWLNDNVIQPTLQWIQDRWTQMGQGIQWVKDHVIQPVFDSLGNALNWLQGVFQTAVDGIARIWDGLRAAAAKPVKFVIDSVWNNGILAAWNKIADFLPGVDKKEPYHADWMGAYARGGVLPGYTPGRDVHDFVSPTGGMLRLSGGESIMRPEWTRAVGGPAAVNAMNKAAINGGVRGVEKQLGEGAAFASGGVIDERIKRTFDALRPEHGKPYQYGGTGNPSWDCSGLWSGVVQSLNGGDLRGGRIFNTESNFANFGFTPGAHGRVTIGVMNGGGGENSHMAGTIDGVNIESSGNNGVQIGGLARGTDASIFNAQYTLEEFLGEFISGGAGGGGGNPIAGVVRRAWDEIVNPIKGAIESAMGGFGDTAFAQIPMAFFNKVKDSVWNFIKSKIPFGGGNSGNGPGPQGGNVEQYRGLVERLLQEKGQPVSLTDSVLRRMNQESGGDPGAINNWDSNAAAGMPSKGLMQVIDPTFQSNKDPGHDDIWNPEDNIRASMNYALRQYGSLSAAYDRAGGYAMGGVLPMNLPAALFDTGGMFPHGSMAVNLSGAKEAVFNAAQWDVLKNAVLSNAQWANVAAPMVASLEKIANYQAPEGTKGPKNWGEVGDIARKGYIEGATKDALDVFGLPSLADIPALKALDEYDSAVAEYQQALQDQQAASEATTDAANAATVAANQVAMGDSGSPSGTSVEVAPTEPAPAPGAAAGHLIRAAGEQASAAANAAGVAAQAAGLPGGAQLGAAAGAGITFVAANTDEMYQMYRREAAKAGAGMRGAR